MQAADEPATDGRKMPGGGIVLSGSGVMAAHAQDAVLDVGGP